MSWTIEDIQDLLTLESGESEILEFKADLPARSDKGRAELLKDVSAMLNSSGGTIIYGIQEVDGKADSLSISKIENVDETIRRFAQLVQTRIEPAAEIRSSVLTLTDGEVLIVEVPQSFAGPFRFKFNDKYRFVKRYERHIGDFTYEQLRSAFSASSDRLDKIERWWKNVSPSDYFSRPMLGGPQMTCALVPVAFDGRNTLLEPTKVESDWPSMIMNGWGGGSNAFNYFGLSCFPGGVSGEVKAFTQADRRGAILAWRSLRSFNYSDKDMFYGAWFVGFIRSAFLMQKKVFKTFGLTGSFVFFARLTGVNGWEMKTVGGNGFEDSHEGTIADIEAGPVFISDIDAVDESTVELFAQIADRLWQAYGVARCPRKLLSDPI